MVKTTFTIGDLVKLNSGGPLMTVVQTGNPVFGLVEGEQVKCEWFDGGQSKKEWFNPDLLVIQPKV